MGDGASNTFIPKSAKEKITWQTIGSLWSRARTGARKRDGSEFPVEVSLTPYEDHGGFHVIAAVRDVSDRRHVEVALRASERLLREMLNALPVLIAFVDPDQRYRYVNDNYGKWFNLDPTRMVGRTAR